MSKVIDEVALLRQLKTIKKHYEAVSKDFASGVYANEMKSVEMFGKAQGVNEAIEYIEFGIFNIERVDYDKT